MNRDSTCPVCYLSSQLGKRCIIYTRYKFGLFGNPKASDEDRTRDTNLEGWDVTATPHSQERHMPIVQQTASLCQRFPILYLLRYDCTFLQKFWVAL